MDKFKTAALDAISGFMWVAIILICALLFWMCLLAATIALMWVGGQPIMTFEFWDVVSIEPILIVACAIVGFWFIGSTIRQCREIDKEREKRFRRDNIRTNWKSITDYVENRT